MTRPAVLGLAVLLLAGCRKEPTERKLPAFRGSVPATALDSLVGEWPVEVSVTGTVAEPHDGLLLLLDDGTGLVRVALPESTGVPVGTRVLVQGLLRRDDAGPLLEAEEWHYDSTAVPVRSPGP